MYKLVTEGETRRLAEARDQEAAATPRPDQGMEFRLGNKRQETPYRSAEIDRNGERTTPFMSFSLFFVRIFLQLLYSPVCFFSPFPVVMGSVHGRQHCLQPILCVERRPSFRCWLQISNLLFTV